MYCCFPTGTLYIRRRSQLLRESAKAGVRLAFSVVYTKTIVHCVFFPPNNGLNSIQNTRSPDMKGRPTLIFIFSYDPQYTIDDEINIIFMSYEIVGKLLIHLSLNVKFDKTCLKWYCRRLQYFSLCVTGGISLKPLVNRLSLVVSIQGQKKKIVMLPSPDQNLKIGSVGLDFFFFFFFTYRERVEFSNIFFTVSKWGKLGRNAVKTHIQVMQVLFYAIEYKF